MPKSDDASDAIAEFLGSLVAIFLGVMLRGWVLQCMWGWYIAPFGLKELSIWHALGLSLTISCFVSGQKKLDSDESAIQLALLGMCISLAVLGFGWLFSFGM